MPCFSVSFAQAKSLREISGGLACCMGKLRHLGITHAPSRSTLSYANKNRSWKLFRDLFYDTFELCRKATPGKHKFRFRNKLLSLDSATISLCLNLFPWGKFRRTKRGSLKLQFAPGIQRNGANSWLSLLAITLFRNGGKRNNGLPTLLA